jgi:hypothetical protein
MPDLLVTATGHEHPTPNTQHPTPKEEESPLGRWVFDVGCWALSDYSGLVDHQRHLGQAGMPDLLVTATRVSSGHEHPTPNTQHPTPKEEESPLGRWVFDVGCWALSDSSLATTQVWLTTKGIWVRQECLTCL